MKLYILFIFCVLSVSLFGQKAASIPDEQELIEAVTENFPTLAERLVDEGIDVNITNNFGQSLLMLAIREGHKEMIKFLISKGANVNYRNDLTVEYKDHKIRGRRQRLEGLSALDYAVASSASSAFSMVDLLLDAGVDNEVLRTAVENASENNNVKMTYYLLQKGAKVSKEKARDLVILHIQAYEDSDGIVRSVNVSDFQLISVWRNHGILTDNNSLLSSSLVRNKKDRQNVINYMSEYRKWKESEANTQTVSLVGNSVQKPRRNKGIDPSFDKNQWYSEITKKKMTDEKIQEQKDHDKKMILTFIGLATLAIVVWKRQFITSFWSWFLLNPKGIFSFWSQSWSWSRFWSLLNPNIPYPPTSNNNPAPNSIPIQSPVPNNFAPSLPVKPKKEKFKRKKMQDAFERGWTEDNTVEIEVLFLTIEDMINPILLRNEHEKAVREMIAYLRKLENLSDEYIAEIMGRKGFVKKLNSLWKSIDPNNVRDIYKRSLYILVAYYAERDKRVNVFLDKTRFKK